MPATIRIDFDVHAEAIGKALQAELAKIQGVVAQANSAIEQSRSASTKRIVATSIQEEQKGLASIQQLKQKAEQEIAQMREGFSAKVWGSEKQAATAIVNEIKRLQEEKEQNIYLLKQGNLSKEQADFVKGEQTKVELAMKTMRRIALENEQIRERGAGAEVGIMGQGRNLDAINMKATKLKALFASGLGIAAVATSMGLFSKSTGEAVGQIESVVGAGLGMAASIGGVAKAVLTAAQAQKVLNVAMAAAPWAVGIAAIGLIIGYWDEITEALKSAWEWVKKAYQSFNDFFESLGPLGTALKYLVAPITLVIDGVSALVGALDLLPEAQEEAAAATDTAAQSYLAAASAANAQARAIASIKVAQDKEVENLSKTIDEQTALYMSLEDAFHNSKNRMTKAEIATQMESARLEIATAQMQLAARKKRLTGIEEITNKTVEVEKKAAKELAVEVTEAFVGTVSSVAARLVSNKDLFFAMYTPLPENVEKRKAFAQSVTDYEIHQLNLRKAKGEVTEQEYQDELFRIRLQGLEDELKLYDVTSEAFKIVLDKKLQLQRDYEVQVAGRSEEAAKVTEASIEKQVELYTQAAQSVFSLIGAIKDLSRAEHQRDKEADERLQKQLEAHEAMSESNAGLAKDEKEAQAIRRKGEEQRSQMLAQRNAEEEQAAQAEEERAQRQNTANLIQTASTMTLAIAKAIKESLDFGLAALVVGPALVAFVVSLFQSSKSGLGFRKGGYTGDGREDEEAGIVHRKEFVLPAGSFARDSQGKIIHIDPQLIGGTGNKPSESIRLGAFLGLTGDKGQKADTSIRMGVFLGVMEENNKLLRQVLASKDSGRSKSRMMYQRSLNRESV